MDYLKAILLGILQGISEFLPISSSGHLALAEALFGIESGGITFEIVVHAGTLLSIVVYYRALLGSIIRALFRQAADSAGRMMSRTRGAAAPTGWLPETRLAGHILLSMLPAMVVGFTLKDEVEQLFGKPTVVSALLIFTGGLLFLTRRVQQAEERINWRTALVMGLAQAFALLPGISRAGSTITAGILMKTNREEAATFSFLMVLPVIAGATLLEILDLASSGLDSQSIGILLTGFATAFLSGYAALGSLIAVLKRRRFHVFAFYCWAVGLCGLAWFGYFA